MVTVHSLVMILSPFKRGSDMNDKVKMKKLFVHQRLSEGYLGPKYTPEMDQYVYQVDKVINSTHPNVMQRLTKAELNTFCESEEWTVYIFPGLQEQHWR